MNEQMSNQCEHGVVLGGWCRTCAEPTEVTPELVQAVERTLYHSHDVTPIMVTMILGKEFVEAPPLPTEEEKKQATEIVEQLLSCHKTAWREAVLEVTGEDIEDW